MGYELDRLMRQYGVSSPTLSYAGANTPTKPADFGATKDTSATDTTQVPLYADKAAYDAAMSKYNTDLATANADRASYDAYRQDYLNRISNTPQYVQAQYNTGNQPVSAGMRHATSPGQIGAEQYNTNIRDWLARHPNATYADILAAQNEGGAGSISNRDIYGATGNYWGNTLKPPSYGSTAYTPQTTLTPPPATTGTTTGTTMTPNTDTVVGTGQTGVTVNLPMASTTNTLPSYKANDLANLDEDLQIPGMYRYAQGGSVHSMARKYSIGGDAMTGGEPQGAADLPMPAVTADPTAAPVPAPEPKPVARPAPTTTPMSPAANDLMAMMQRYTGPSEYAPELAAARQRMSTENAAFDKMIQEAMKTQNSAPDKAEMYFRLAAAFGAPTRTGHFGETLAGVGKELGEYAKDVRTARKADQQLRTQLGIEAQKLKAQSAKEELHSLQALAGEEAKDKRAVVMEYIKSGRPQSEAGKAAVDAGLTQGTPEFTQFVNKYVDDKIRSGNLFKEAMVAIAGGQLQVAQSRENRAAESAAKLSPQEVKLKSEAETTLGGLDDSMASLKRAYALNPNTFDGTLASIAQRKVLEQTDPQDVRVLATREQSNLLSKGAIDKLRASFGGNPTEGERAALLSLEGLDSKSKEERAQIMKNTYKLLQARRAREQKRLNDINAGLYRETTPAPSEGIE